MTYYTYAHTRNDTNAIFYVGKGHKNRICDKNNRNSFWKNIVAKHGFSAIKLANWENEKDAFEHEKFLISCFRKLGYKLANIGDGGEGGTFPKSEETKQKISIAKKGIKNLKLQGELNPAKKIESRIKRSIAMNNFYQSGGKNPMQGKQRKDLSERNKSIKRCGDKNHKSVAIEVDGIQYQSILQASKALGITNTKLRYWAYKDPARYKTKLNCVG